MPRPHQAGGTLRRHRQIRLPRGGPSVVKQGGSATRSRRARQTPSPVVKEDLPPPPRIPHKLAVASAAGSASAQTLQDPDISYLGELLDTTSLKESISDSPLTVPHETIGGSSSAFPSNCQKLVTDQKYAEDSESFNELLGTTSSKESITANLQTLPHNTISGLSRTFQSRFGKPVTGVAESTSALALQEPDVSCSDEFLDSSSEEFNTASPRAVPHNTIEGSLASASSIGNKILIWRSLRCFKVFYIRIDRRGSFWIYPNLGGPFQSIDETENAINSFLDVLQWEKRTGTTKGASNSLSRESTHSNKWYLVQAILDQYNDENNLSGVVTVLVAKTIGVLICSILMRLMHTLVVTWMGICHLMWCLAAPTMRMRTTITTMMTMTMTTTTTTTTTTTKGSYVGLEASQVQC